MKAILTVVCGLALVPAVALAELPAGSAVPDVGGMTQDGKELRLKDLRGKFVVLYFYPKDDTSGCTKEACSFRDSSKEYSDLGAVVIGVSTDDVQSHVAFAKKYGLRFTLVADTKKELLRAFQVGSLFGFSKRRTFVIDPKGVVRKVFTDVNPDVHSGEVLATLRSLGAVKQ